MRGPVIPNRLSTFASIVSCGELAINDLKERSCSLLNCESVLVAVLMVMLVGHLHLWRRLYRRCLRRRVTNQPIDCLLLQFGCRHKDLHHRGPIARVLVDRRLGRKRRATSEQLAHLLFGQHAERKQTSRKPRIRSQMPNAASLLLHVAKQRPQSPRRVLGFRPLFAHHFGFFRKLAKSRWWGKRRGRS